jgi:hypothetical protein
MLFIGLLAAVAADKATPSSDTASSNAGSYIDGGTWTYPSIADVLSTGFDVSANVVIDCGIAKSGHMSDCFVGEADGSRVRADDKNVGAAYLALASVDPSSIGGVQPGDRVQFHYNWSDLPHSDLKDAKRIPAISTDQTVRFKTAKWTIPSDGEKFNSRILRESVNGATLIDCMIAPDGTMKSCSILAEVPVGYGVGDFAAKGFEKFARVDPSTITGSIQPGDHYLFKLNLKSNE